jgi:hypothetical protein
MFAEVMRHFDVGTTDAFRHCTSSESEQHPR